MNKVNTKVTLHWPFEESPHLPAKVAERLTEKYGNRINNDGELVVSSQRFREQGRNVADCLNKLRDMIAEAAVVPKKRKKTKPSKASKERRLKEKKAVGQKKQRRSERIRLE